MKKRLVTFLSLFMVFLFAAGCNNNDNATPPAENTNNAQESENAKDHTNNNNNTVVDTKYPFTGFDLEVKYADNKEYEVDYDVEEDGTKATIEDDIKNERVRDNEAMKRLDKIFNDMKIDANTADDQVISEVKRLFNIKDDYQRLELEIDFKDGTEKEYVDQK